jgi:Flp pilus assembly protein TadG
MRLRFQPTPLRLQWPRLSSRSGTAAVQFAFCAPVVIFLVLGMIEVGRGLMVSHELASAARNACRIGVLDSKGYGDITAAVDNSLKPQGITGYTTTVKVNDTVVTPSTFAPNSNDEITVQVTVPVSNITWLPGGTFLRGNLTGQYNLRRE